MLDYISLASFALIALLAAVYHLKYRAVKTPSSPTLPRDSKHPLPETSDTFTYPPITPCTKPLSEMKPMPYRPFRWGDYHVTMGIKTISSDDWIEVDNQFATYHKIRTDRVAERGSQLVQTLPADEKVPVSGADAARELADELCEYLSRRYPNLYTVERDVHGSGGWYGEGRIVRINVLPVNATYDLTTEDPMKVAGLLVQDDLAIMIEGTDGVYYLRAGAIIIPGFWRLTDKIGMSLDEIHFSGRVPQYPTKLQTSMNRFFQRLTYEKFIQRNNYHFAVAKDPKQAGGSFDKRDPYELAWAENMVGAEDAFQAGTGLGVQEGEATGKHGSGRMQIDPDWISLRQERQTLRRLPRSRGIVFTVRTYLEPVSSIAKEVGVPGRMASAIRSWPEDVAEYKSRDRFQHELLPYLDQKHAEQIAAGLIEEGERPQTNYPF